MTIVFTPPADSYYSGFFYALVLEAMETLGANADTDPDAAHTGPEALVRAVCAVAAQKYGADARARLAGFRCLTGADIGLAVATMLANGTLSADGTEDFGRFAAFTPVLDEVLGPLAPVPPSTTADLPQELRSLAAALDSPDAHVALTAWASAQMLRDDDRRLLATGVSERMRDRIGNVLIRRLHQDPTLVPPVAPRRR